MKRACIFASYWHEPRLPGYIHYHVAELARLGFDIHFVSNSPIDEVSRERLNENCRSIRERENVGLDFAAWRDVLNTLDLDEYDGLLLTNSSIVGPLFNLAPMFDAMDQRRCDFWGLTVNRFRQRHLQSFFLYFKASVLRSEAWDRFWDAVQDHTDKRQIIKAYERGIYWHFSDAGFAGASYIKPNPLRTLFWPLHHLPSRKKPVYFDDPTMTRPLAIIGEGFPYIKASLLWGEAKHLRPSLSEFKREDTTEYDWSLIKDLI